MFVFEIYRDRVDLHSRISILDLKSGDFPLNIFVRRDKRNFRVPAGFGLGFGSGSGSTRFKKSHSGSLG